MSPMDIYGIVSFLKYLGKWTVRKPTPVTPGKKPLVSQSQDGQLTEVNQFKGALEARPHLESPSYVKLKQEDS